MTARLRWITGALTLCAALLGASAVDAQSAPRHPTHASSAASAPSSTAATPAAPQGVVNINTAGADELERLPGVGPARAAAIVALRQRVQRFRAADDLLRVRGIGRAGMHRLRPYVVLTGETTLAARPGRTPRAHASPATASATEGGS